MATTEVTRVAGELPQRGPLRNASETARGYSPQIVPTDALVSATSTIVRPRSQTHRVQVLMAVIGLAMGYTYGAILAMFGIGPAMLFVAAAAFVAATLL